MNQEIIARLTGLLNFKVDLSGLQRFNTHLSQVERRMKAMSLEADKLAKKMGLNPKPTASTRSASLEQAQRREAQLEASLAKAKRETLAAALDGQRLQFAGYKQAFVLNSAGIRQQQAMLAAEKMLGRAQGDRLDDQAQELKRIDALTAARTKQAALEQSLLQQRAKIAVLKQPETPRPSTSAQHAHNLKRELQLESAVAKAKRYTFAAELAGKKLEYAGQKQAVFMANAAIRDKQALAVADAKAHKAHLERLKAQGVEIKNTATLAAAKTRQASLEQRLQQQQIKTATMRQKHLQGLTGMQRMELALEEARERGLRAAQKFADGQRTAKLREQRQTEAHQQRTERFEGWKARQAHWETTRNSRSNDSGLIGGLGVGGLSLALGAAGAAAYALTSALAYANERVKQRQEGVQEAQGFNNTFMSISKNPDNVKSYRDSFIKVQMENGGVIDTDTAKDFRTLAINMSAAGKSQQQILETWNTRQKAFAVAGTSKDDNKELNKQLGQMASDGTGAASDANIINDRMPMLTPFVVQEYMKEHKITDYNKGLAKYNKDLKGGKGVKYAWYANAMDNLVRENEPSLERNRNSVASQQQRADNQAYLQANNINSNDELAKVIGERIKAERELNEAMQPVNAAFAEMDVGLTKFKTTLAYLLTGKDAEGNTTTPEQKAAALGVAGGADGIITLPTQNLAPQTEQQRLDASAADPVNKFWSWLFGNKSGKEIADENRERWAKVTVPLQDLLGTQFSKLDMSKFDNSQLPKHLEDLMTSPVMQAAARYSAESVSRTPSVNAVVKSDEGAKDREPVVNNVNNSTTNVTNSPTLNVTVNAPSNDPEQLARIVGKEVDQKLNKAFQQTNTDLTEAH